MIKQHEQKKKNVQTLIKLQTKYLEQRTIFKKFSETKSRAGFAAKKSAEL